MPFVNVLGDTKDQAIDIFANQRLNLFLQDADDEDWFKWTNNTGTPNYIIVAAYSKERNNTITVGVVLKYANGLETTLLLSEPSKLGNGNPAAIENFYVPEGATLFIRVKADTFAETAPYELVFMP